MKIECCSCRESFEVPDGKGINRAICPFCEKPNDLRKPALFNRSSHKEPSAQNNVQQTARIIPVNPSHPLAPQLWIISICTLIITTIIVAGVLFSIITTCMIAHEMEPVLKELEQTMGKSSREMQKSMDKMQQFQKNLNKSLRP